MDNFNTYSPQDGWEYGTGRTQPPKNRGGTVALLLVLVIFLTGIVTVLGILNIRLFRQLNAREELEELAISFVPAVEETISFSPEEAAQFPAQDFSMDLTEGSRAEPNVSQEGALSLQEIYRRCIPSVVSITGSQRGGSVSGTGVILSSDGYIVTNAHVIADSVSITVQLTDERVLPARIVGLDTVSDLAVLHVDTEGLTPARFGSSDQVQVGDSVVAIGDPLGSELRGTMTDGIISAINRDVVLDGRTVSLLQTNAALNSGNSGGPLIDCYGNVIGINTLKIGDYMSRGGVEGLGFAIPSSTVKDIVDQLIAQGYVSGRPTLGLEGESLSMFYQHYYHVPAGLYLTVVDEHSNASQAGILPGDILLAVDGQGVTTMAELNRILYTHDIGDSVTVTIFRGGRQADVPLTIQEDKS